MALPFFGGLHYHACNNRKHSHDFKGDLVNDLINSPPDRPRPGTLRRGLLTLAAMLLPVVALFGALEIGARVWELWNPPMRVDLGQGFDDSSRLFLPSAKDRARMATNPDKLVSFRDEFFAKIKAPRTLRIFALGGSSVNYAKPYFDDMTRRLKEELKARYDAVEVIDCGGLSYGSHRLVLIAREVVQYDPDVVLFYEAHNEFEELQQLGLANLPAASTQRTLSHSALYRFIRDLLAKRQISRLETEKRQRDLANALPDASKSWMHKFTPEEIAGRMQAFHDNLTAIVRLCREHSVPVILGSVPSNLIKPSLPGPEGARYEKEVLPLFATGEWEKGAALGREILKNASPRHQSSDTENGILRALCRDMDVPLADVGAAVIATEPHQVPGETLFSDHCHLNGPGNEILGHVYEQKILALIAPDR